MAHRLALTVVFSLLASVSAWAQADTKACSAPPDKGAYIGFWRPATVSITQNFAAGTCSISIDGAPVHSPPADALKAAVNRFRDGSLAFTKDSVATTGAIAMLLVAAAPVETVPADVLRVVSEQSGFLMSCIRDFFEKEAFGNPRESSSLSCRTWPAAITPAARAQAQARFEPTGEVDTLEIRLRWSQYLSRLYLSRDTPKAPRVR